MKYEISYEFPLDHIALPRIAKEYPLWDICWRPPMEYSVDEIFKSLYVLYTKGHN